MFKKLGNWFEQQIIPEHQSSSQHTVEMATAVLLFETMQADRKLEDSEVDMLKKRLHKQFHLSEQELQALFEACQSKSKEAVDFQQFTRVLNEHCDVDEKHQILESLWRVAWADQHLDVHEVHVIRKISDLLHIPHSQFIQSKLKVTGQ